MCHRVGEDIQLTDTCIPKSLVAFENGDFFLFFFLKLSYIFHSEVQAMQVRKNLPPGLYSAPIAMEQQPNRICLPILCCINLHKYCILPITEMLNN